MKKFLTISLCMTTLLAVQPVTADVLPYLSFRSQGVNAARELVGWQTQINKADMCNTYGSFSITPEYTRSFETKGLAKCLFGDAARLNCCDHPTLYIQGSKVTARNTRALMADNFYLPTDYDGIVTVAPRIENFLIDFNMYIGKDICEQGFYFRMHGPVTYTRWGLNFDEDILNPGSNAYDPGYFTNSWTFDATQTIGLANSSLLDSFEEFVSDGLSIRSTGGITFNPLSNARWSRCTRTKTGVAEIEMALGWNFIACQDHHLGLQIRGAAPTGNRPQGRWLFEPIVGQGKHWELGAGLTSHWSVCKSEDECQSFDMYVDANITHLFKTRQCRTFDLCGKPLSRYMLACRMGTPVENLYAIESATISGGGVVTNLNVKAPAVQFKKEFMPLANITTIPVDVSAAVQADLVLKLAWTRGNLQFDLGYNFWGRSCEKICKRYDCCDRKFPENTWSLKGDAYVFGFNAAYDFNNPIIPPTNIGTNGIPLSATESRATIYNGTNNWPDGLDVTYDYNVPFISWPIVLPSSTNPGIDNYQLAASTNIPTNYLISSYKADGNTSSALLPLPNNRWYPVNTSLEAVLIKETDLDIQGARSSSYSNKIFTHIGYTWDCSCLAWAPYLGLGGEVEFGHHGDNANCCTKSCSALDTCCTSNTCKRNEKQNTCCKSCAISQWGIWFKGGVSFK